MKFPTLFFLIGLLFTANAKASSHNLTVLNLQQTADTSRKADTINNSKTKGKKKSIIGNAKSSSAAKNDTSVNPGALKSQVTSHADDSTIVDKANQITYLYGNARVKYEDFELDADYIRLDQKNHLLFAKGSIDPITHRYVGRPISKQAKDKPLYSDSLVFDYKTKKGKLYNPASDQDGNYLSGGQAKRLNETEVAYRNVLFSTCDLPYPDTHFGIVITRGIAEKTHIISGPAYLEIEGIPLPLAIPFGFFPKPETRASGVIIPTFGEDQKLGFYLRNFGYYIGFSDYLDLTTTGTVYSKGSYELNTTAHYLKRYSYGGTFSLSYGSHNYGLPGDPAAKDFNVTWSHTQDPNSNPGTTFSASVNAGTSTFYQNNPATTNYNLQALTQNNLRSSINYARTWAGTPFNLSVGISHSQDLTAKTINLSLPTLSFTMASLSPFDPKDRVGEQKWYQKITVSYSLQANNSVTSIPEAELFKGNTLLRSLQTTAVHQIPVSLSLNVLKYFQFSSSVNYTEHWYLKSVKRRYATGAEIDSLGLTNNVISDTINGFKRADSYNLSTGISTKVYSTFSFKKGNLIAIRHVMTPSLSFNYNPNFGDPSYGYYKTIVSNATVPYPYTSQTYSEFLDGFPGIGKSAGIGFNLDNTLEIKLKPKNHRYHRKAQEDTDIAGVIFVYILQFCCGFFQA